MIMNHGRSDGRATLNEGIVYDGLFTLMRLHSCVQLRLWLALSEAVALRYMSVSGSLMVVSAGSGPHAHER